MVVCLTDVSEILYALNTSPVTKDIQSTALNLILVNLASCDKIFSQVLTTGQWNFANSYQIWFVLFFFYLFILTQNLRLNQFSVFLTRSSQWPLGPIFKSFFQHIASGSIKKL